MFLIWDITIIILIFFIFYYVKMLLSAEECIKNLDNTNSLLDIIKHWNFFPTILNYIHHPITVTLTRSLANENIISFSEYNYHWFKLWKEVTKDEFKYICADNDKRDELLKYKEIDYGIVYCVMMAGQQDIYAKTEEIIKGECNPNL